MDWKRMPPLPCEKSTSGKGPGARATSRKAGVGATAARIGARERDPVIAPPAGAAAPGQRGHEAARTEGLDHPAAEPPQASGHRPLASEQPARRGARAGGVADREQVLGEVATRLAR